MNDRCINLPHYNAPTTDEIGALMVGGDVDEANARDIVVHSNNGYFQCVSPLHTAYAPLHYVLLFPNGHNRWHDDIPLNGFQWDSSRFIQDDENIISLVCPVVVILSIHLSRHPSCHPSIQVLHPGRRR